MATQPNPEFPIDTPIDDPVPTPVDPIPLTPSDPVIGAVPAPAGDPLIEGP